MSRKRKGLALHGWVNFDKPYDMTSTQAVGKIRWLHKAQKAGHAGTLDPLATGVLPIALGEATKTIAFAQNAMKTYEFTVTWGEHRDTLDAEGEVLETSDVRPALKDIEAALLPYIGDIEQVPPKYSAIKVDGARAYDLARGGTDVELKSRPVYIEAINIINTEKESASFRMDCGKGTYVRAFARDIAAELGTCGYISALRRTRVGPFRAEYAISLAELEEFDYSSLHDAGETDISQYPAILPLERSLDDIPALPLKADEMVKMKNGNMLTFIAKPDYNRLVKAGLETNGPDDYAEGLAVFEGTPIALIEVNGAKVQPVRVFNL